MLNYLEIVEDLKNIDAKYTIPTGALQVTSNAVALILDLVVTNSQLNEKIDGLKIKLNGIYGVKNITDAKILSERW